MKRILSLLPVFLWFPATLLLAQTNIPLKYNKDVPKNLYAARTAVLVNYITNKKITPEEENQKVNEITTKLIGDNQQLGLQLVHFANKNALLQPAQKARLIKQYDSLKVANLFMLEVTDIKDQGAEGSYVLLLTPYNRTAKLMTAQQTAYTRQADAYQKLIRDFKADIDGYKPAYFLKAPARTTQKPAIAAVPEPVIPKANPKKDGKPYQFPAVSLIEEDAKRLYGGPHNNFYYYVGANMQERNAGFFGQHLRKDIEAAPDAVKELNKFRNLKYMYLAERGVFLASIILYAEEVASNDERVYFNDKQKVYVGMFAGSLLINHMLSRATNKHIFRAIDEYNAFATMKNNTGMRWLKPDNFGLGSVKSIFPSSGVSLSWNIR